MALSNTSEHKYFGIANAKHGLNESANAGSQLCQWSFVRKPCENCVCVGHRSGDVVVHSLNMIILLGFIIWNYHVSLYASLSHQCLPPHRLQHHWGGCGGGGG